MTTLPEAPRSALIDPSTGQLTREWVRFFDDLRRSIISGLDDSVGGRLDALEADSLFDGGDESGGTGSSYNDTVLRGRLDALETDLLFPPSFSGGADAELTARMALLEGANSDRELEQALAPDPAALMAVLRSRLEALELGAATTVDAAAQLLKLQRRLSEVEINAVMAETASSLVAGQASLIRGLAGRLADLETEALF